jgi:ADP-ribosyl-[dinitrogen reductase] hydrolase
MRVAPIGLVYHGDLELALSIAISSSDATHPYPTCAEACAIYTRLIVSAMRSESKGQLATTLSCTAVEDLALKERLDRYSSINDWNFRQEVAIKSSGYVVDTLEAALWAFFTTDTFEDGAVRVVNLGDDADTVGAVYGGLAGAFYGVEAIPERWIEGLSKPEMVEAVVSGLVNL